MLVLTSQSPDSERSNTATACAMLGWWWVQALCQGVLIALSFAVRCLECKSVSDTYEPFLDLSLEIMVLQQG